MAIALLLDSNRKITKQIKPGLQSSRINLRSTEEKDIFLTWLEKGPADVVLMSLSESGPRVQDVAGVLKQVWNLHPAIPALLLVSGTRGPKEWNALESLCREQMLVDIVRCEASFAREVSLRTSRLLERSTAALHEAVQRFGGSAVRDVSPKLKHLVPALHNPETGRIDATKVSELFAVPLTQVAEMLDAKFPTVHKTPDAPALQEKLGLLERIAAALLRLTGSASGLRMWLNAPNPDLTEKVPLALLKEGKGEAVANLLEDVLLGQPG